MVIKKYNFFLFYFKFNDAKIKSILNLHDFYF